MSKHTPGPWIDKGFIDVNAMSEATLIGNRPMLLVWHEDPDKLTRDICWVGGPDNEAMANARLIAAAPELLDALENLVRPLEKGWKVDDMGNRIAEARAVLTKAQE